MTSRIAKVVRLLTILGVQSTLGLGRVTGENTQSSDNATTATTLTNFYTSTPYYSDGVVVSISPVHGPSIGGTRVSIDGISLPHTISQTAFTVLFNESAAEIVSQEDMGRIVVIAPASEFPGVVTIALLDNDTKNILKTTSTYIYDENPIVYGIYPQESIISGGITQTIIGKHFDFQENFQTIIYGTTSDCKVHNSTTLLCIVPFLSNLVFGTNQSFVEKSYPNFHVSSNMIITVNTIVLHNVSINIYPNPLIQVFQPTSMEFIANQNLRLNFTVIWPDAKINWSEYATIQLGSSKVCREVEIDKSNNLLTCRPPSISPYEIRFGSTDQQQPDVIITVAFLKVKVGQLLYINIEPFNIIMSIMIAIMAFICLISIVFGCITICSMRRSHITQKSKNNNENVDEEEQIKMNEKTIEA